MDHLSEYIVTLFAPEDEPLGALREEADRTGVSPASISADAGRFLQVLLRASRSTCGRVVNASSAVDDEELRAVRDFNQRIAGDPRLTSILVPAYDGLVVAIVGRR